MWFNANTTNMKYAVHQMAMRAVDYTFKREQSRYWTFIMTANEGNPFYCSDGGLDADLSSPHCKRIIGYSISQQWIQGPRKLLFDRGLDAGHEDYVYFALLRNEKDEVEKMELEKNAGISVGRFRALFPTDRTQWKYKSGVMSHTAFPWWTSQRFSQELPGSPYLNHDVYDLITDYVQGTLGSFNQTGASEAVAGLETQEQLVQRTDAKLK